MTTAKVDDLSISSVLNILQDKYISKQHVLFEEELEKMVSKDDYLVSWSNPSVLSKTYAYEITQHSILHSEIQDWINTNSNENIRAYFNLNAHVIVLYNHLDIYIQSFDLKSKKSSTITLPLIDLSTQQTASSLFDIFIDKLNVTSIMIAVNNLGKIHYYQDCFKNVCIKFEVPLKYYNEYITSVKLVDADQAVIGSSTGEIYVVTFQKVNSKKNQIQMNTLYKRTFTTTELLHFPNFVKLRSMNCLSNENKPPIIETGPIISICALNDLYYICSNKDISIWKYNKQYNQMELVFRKKIELDIIDNVAKHIPSQISKESIKCDIVNMNIITNNEVVILASYTVPEMKNYVQYIVIKFCIELNDNEFLIYVNHTASIPYSDVRSTLRQKIPQLLVTQNMAFIAFDRAVIAVSLDRKSVFEESIVLCRSEDSILWIEEMNEKENDLNSVLVMTAKSGFLKFQINISKIQESRLTGNIYASLVENIERRDTLVFKSRLEQAVFFGEPDKSPLQFPLRVEQEDISIATMSLLNDIQNGICPFLPKTLDFDLYIEAKYYFQKRIFGVLKDNMLHNQLTSKERYELMKTTELYYISCILKEYFKNHILDIHFKQHLVGIIQTITGTKIIDDDLQIEEFLKNYILKIKILFKQFEFFRSFPDTFDILTIVVVKTYIYEEKCFSIYGLDKRNVKRVSAQLSDILSTVLNNVIKDIKNHKDSVDPMDLDYTENNNKQENSIITDSSSISIIKQRLFGAIKLLLNTLKMEQEMNENPLSKQMYNNLRKMAFKGLCIINQYELAIELAKDHNCTTFVIKLLQNSQLSYDEMKEKNIDYINLFGKQYFNPLLEYLEKQNQHQTMLELCLLFPDFANDFLVNNSVPKVSWIFYLRQNEFLRSLNSLNEYLQTDLTEEQRDFLSSWYKMISVAISEISDKANP
ncbi:uncharacterized protein BX663DRAFT_507770 [Cokeromyces recurvatus]|uniref:uncharacterized protein n=1 Tax=Cokeromyces recurvatus TaxID=90255 RepID=UPI002220FBD3|nr:uncharacterized protein BX663DRAFT_507770 [Cokeromyces recurvatus]KAI7903184.1 hypothetical protein BX663DRAFT_507770 [Cokeromyces recurvatus]